MSTDSPHQRRPLPERPNLRHLKAQAKDLFLSGGAESLTDAQFKIARLYGFASWPKLKAHVDSLEEIGQLKQAIDGKRSRARRVPHDTQSGPASCSAWLWEKWSAHLGCGVSRTVGAAKRRETHNGGVDDRSWVGCSSGW